MRIKTLLIGIIFLISSKLMASEYYGLIIGKDNTENVVFKATCYEFPLNKYIDVFESKSEKFEKYLDKEKVEYLKIGITYDDDFYQKSNLTEFIELQHLKDPELIKKYLTNLWFEINKSKQEMIADGIFENEIEIQEFLHPCLTMIGVLSAAVEMNCTKVTWVTMKY